MSDENVVDQKYIYIRMFKKLIVEKTTKVCCFIVVFYFFYQIKYGQFFIICKKNPKLSSWDYPSGERKW